MSEKKYYVKTVSELRGVDEKGPVKARQTTEYFDAEYINVLFIEKHLGQSFVNMAVEGLELTQAAP